MPTSASCRRRRSEGRGTGRYGRPRSPAWQSWSLQGECRTPPRRKSLNPLNLEFLLPACYKTLLRCGGKESVGKPVVERFTGFLSVERNASAETVRAYRREVECLQRFLREDRNAGDAEPVD